MIDSSCESKSMSKEEIVDNLKTMVFGAQAFDRFNAKERETLDKAWNIIDQYEAKLKVDKVAILKDLKKDIDKLPIIPETSESFKLGQAIAYDNCEFLIQQKINLIKENENADSN